MCDYSLHSVKNRAARIGDKLVTSEFKYTTTRGLTSEDDPVTAVCLLPGTEIAFASPPKVSGKSVWSPVKVASSSCVARFRQVNLDKPCEHHDAFEFADGKFVKVDSLALGQKLSVLQLPPQKKKAGEPVVILAEQKE